jgi:hypothetical protein
MEDSKDDIDNYDFYFFSDRKRCFEIIKHQTDVSNNTLHVYRFESQLSILYNKGRHLDKVA